MAANLSKHGIYSKRWAEGRRVPIPTGITKRHKINPDPEKYLKHTKTNPLCIDVEEDDFVRLEKAVSTKDARIFEQILSTMHWEARSSSDFLRAIHLALAMGAYEATQRISALGKECYPDNEQMQKLAHVFAPPKVTRRAASPDPTIRANRDWLMTHGDEYRGKWVGLRNGQLLDSDDSFDELIRRVGDARDILITTVF